MLYGSCARRKFEKALDKDKQRAEYAMKQFRLLYAIERFAINLDLTIKEIADLRQIYAQPILDKIYTWMIEEYPKLLPKSGIGKAIRLCNFTMVQVGEIC